MFSDTKTSEINQLFSKLDQDARKVCQLKDLLAGLKMRPAMDDMDKLRLANAFISETESLCFEMRNAIRTFKGW